MIITWVEHKMICDSCSCDLTGWENESKWELRKRAKRKGILIKKSGQSYCEECIAKKLEAEDALKIEPNKIQLT